MEAASYLSKTLSCTDVTVLGMEAEPFERVRGLCLSACSSCLADDRLSLRRALQVLGTKLGRFMRSMHEAQKVKFHLSAIVTRFTGAVPLLRPIRLMYGLTSMPVAGTGGRVSGVVLKTGQELPADLVILGAGIIPATEYLKGAVGITVSIFTAYRRSPFIVSVCRSCMTRHQVV
jgi:NADPH-dependent 2,4-dienoyl-CoA reductase/sulfur reductase-like enzyme